MVKLCLQFEYKQTKKNNIHWPIVHFELIGNFIEMIQRYKFKWSYKIPRGNPSVFVIAQMLSWSSQFVQVFQEVYCYLYRLKEEIRKALQMWSISPKERALNEHSEGSRMAIWFSEDASHVVRFCVKKKKEKKLKLLTCVKLIVNIACDLLLVSFIPVLAVTLKVNKIDLKNMFLHVHINCYNSSSGDIVMTNSI